MRSLGFFATLLSVSTVAIASTAQGSGISLTSVITSLVTDPILDGFADSLPNIRPVPVSTESEKRQDNSESRDPRQGLEDAFNDLLPGVTELLGDGIIDDLFDLLRNGENFLTPEWNDQFADVVNCVEPILHDLGRFLGYFIQVLLSGGFGGGGGDLPPLPTPPPGNNTDSDEPGFEWPDFDWPSGGSNGDDSPTSTGPSGPAETGSGGWEFDFPGWGAGGEDDAEEGAGAGEEGSESGSGSGTGGGDVGLGGESETGTEGDLDDGQFTGGAVDMSMNLMLGMMGIAMVGAVNLVFL
ncbi:hypothetical protein BJY04DRAFT_220403 [Aspergillus karnatakaensis]|uniref:uncharacterized protein n=1 Tax=Aspergillus karnatakaensis TaxID=1810916 RepID=UPI003CCD4AC3